MNTKKEVINKLGKDSKDFVEDTLKEASMAVKTFKDFETGNTAELGDDIEESIDGGVDVIDDAIELGKDITNLF